MVSKKTEHLTLMESLSKTCKNSVISIDEFMATCQKLGKTYALAGRRNGWSLTELIRLSSSLDKIVPGEVDSNYGNTKNDN